MRYLLVLISCYLLTFIFPVFSFASNEVAGKYVNPFKYKQIHKPSIYDKIVCKILAEHHDPAPIDWEKMKKLNDADRHKKMIERGNEDYLAMIVLYGVCLNDLTIEDYDYYYKEESERLEQIFSMNNLGK